MVTYLVPTMFAKMLLADQVDRNSLMITPTAYVHGDVFNPSSSAVWVTVLPDTKTFNSTIVQTINIGSLPFGITWNPEFVPDSGASVTVNGSTTTWSWSDDITYPASPDTIILSPGQGARYTTGYNFWVEDQGILKVPPAWEVHYEPNGSGGYNYHILRESTINRNFTSGTTYYMGTPR